MIARIFAIASLVNLATSQALGGLPAGVGGGFGFPGVVGGGFGFPGVVGGRFGFPGVGGGIGGGFPLIPAFLNTANTNLNANTVGARGSAQSSDEGALSNDLFARSDDDSALFFDNSGSSYDTYSTSFGQSDSESEGFAVSNDFYVNSDDIRGVSANAAGLGSQDALFNTGLFF